MWKAESTVLFHKDVNDNDVSTTTMLHNFADDTAVIVSNREEAERIAGQLYHYLQDFLVDLHVATPDIQKSKSVVLFLPAHVSQKEILQERPLCIDPILKKSIAFVPSARYLGHIISKNLSDDLHLEGRMAKAYQAFGALKPQLFGRKSVWKTVKARVLENMIIPTLLDGVECCTVSRKMMCQLETMYLKMVRSSLKITPYTQRKFRITSKTLLRKLGVHPLHYYMDLKVLAYAGHIQRMQPTRLTRIVRMSKLQGSRRRGRPKKMLQANIGEALNRKGIKVRDWKLLAMDRAKWASLIRDDSYTSSRVNFKSRKWRKPYWTRVPRSIIGCHVEKQFCRKWYLGRIISVDTDDITNDTLWSVRYDDGDSEDYNMQELQKILCLDMHAIL